MPNTVDLAHAARRVLAPAAWESMFGTDTDDLGSTDAANVAAWTKVHLQPRVSDTTRTVNLPRRAPPTTPTR
jgi:hypothetical protein